MSAESEPRVTLEEYRAELERFGHRLVRLDFDMTTAMSLIGQMQLALRHPNNRGPSTEICRAQIMAFCEAIPDEFPAIKRLITQGFNANYDDP